jgi:carbonic anhydrase
MKPRLSAKQALERLKQGNIRFVSEGGRSLSRTAPPVGADAVEKQRPIAIVLGCSDSRVPAEMVFDQGFGDLFVIRVAGNIVAPSQIASVEFAASKLGTRLVLVLGHSQCGAITATIDELQREIADRSNSLQPIVDRVRPVVEELMSGGNVADKEALIEQAVRANIHASVDQLRKGSEGIQTLLQNSGLEIIGAEYSLETGEVEFFDH